MPEETKEEIPDYFDPNDIFKGEGDMEVDDFLAQQKPKRIKNKKKKRGKVNKVSNNLRMFARQLQQMDYMLEPDLKILGTPGAFKMFARPEGNRCLITSGYGVTIARDARGFVVSKFSSFLPGGAPSGTQPDLEDEIDE